MRQAAEVNKCGAKAWSLGAMLAAAVVVSTIGLPGLHAQAPAETGTATPTATTQSAASPSSRETTPATQSGANQAAMGAPGAQGALPYPDDHGGSSPSATDPSLVVPAGTKVLLSVQSAVNTRTAKPGDGIYLVSKFPVIVGPRVLIPAGVYVQGIIDQVVRPGRVKGRAKLLMHFTTMIFPNGQVVAIPGGVNTLPGSAGPTVKNSEGEIEQAGNKGKDAGTIAKAGAAGAGLGSIAGIGSGSGLAGAGYGGLAGVAAGGIYTLLSRGDDINITEGSSVEMVLQRPLTLEASQLAGSSNRISNTLGQPQYVPSSTQQQPMPKPRMAMTCPPESPGCN